MSKLHVCPECGYVFPSELSQLIENKIQVYCETCGTAFSQEGVQFKETGFKPKSRSVPSEKGSASILEIITFLNKISYLIILIVAIVQFFLIFEIIFFPKDWAGLLLQHLSLGTAGIIIAAYDRKYINKKIKAQKFNDIVVDSIGLGIVGCILFGAGVVLLIKGIFILAYIGSVEKNRKMKPYDFGRLLKNSFNNFSAIGGIVIILFSLYSVTWGLIVISDVSSNLTTPDSIVLSLVEFLVFLIMAIVSICIDFSLRNKIYEQKPVTIGDFLTVFVTGIVGTIFSAAGIFILLKGIVMFFMLFGKPTPITQSIAASKPQLTYVTQPQEITTPQVQQKRENEVPQIKATPIKLEEEQKPAVSKEAKTAPPQVIQVDQAQGVKSEKEYELKLHESLLPVKDEKDKEIVKQYFSKIFNVLSKDIRKTIMELNISKSERNELLKELGFLAKEGQLKYIEALINLYQELPKKLVERIRKLPSVKPKHYDRIIEQLKYMDIEEQERFVQFLEQNA